jgi:hypothetical protein
MKWRNKSIDRVKVFLEMSDNITSHTALKELFRRKGLNMNDEWIVLARLRDERAKVLVQTDILARVIRKVVNTLDTNTGWNSRGYVDSLIAVL